MKTKSAYTSFALFGLVPILLIAYFLAPLTDTAWFSSKTSGWFSVTDFYSNAHFIWRLNPLLALFTAWGGYTTYALLCLTLFMCGMFALSTDKEDSIPYSTLIPFLAGVTLLMLFGINLPVLSLAAAVPWILWCINFNERNWKEILFVGLISSLTLGAPCIFAALILVPCVLFSKNHSYPSSLILLLTLITLTTLLAIPHQPSVPYPQDARLVPGYGFHLGIDPIISFGPNKPFIDRSFTQSFITVPAFLILIASLWLSFSSNATTKKHVAIISSLFAASALLESNIFPHEIRLIGPIQSLARIIPGLIAYPLSLYVIAIGVVLIASFGLTREGRISTFTCLAALLTYSILTPQNNSISFGTLARPHTHLEQSVINSPSLYLIRQRPEIMHQMNKHPDAQWKNIADLTPIISASVNSDAVTAIISERTRDRWSTKLGAQVGDEWIKIELQNPIIIAGINLTLKKFITDFPRGIEITGGASCEAQSVLFQEKQWLGSTRYTEGGLPYYSHESIIEIPLKEVTVKCITIRQISSHPSLEWSVESILLK